MDATQIVKLLKKQETELAAAMVACRVNAGQKAVHVLRTSSRRMRALVEKMLEDHAQAGKGLHRKGRKLLRELVKMGRAAGVVRDLDIHQRQLRRLRLGSSEEAIKEREAMVARLDALRVEEAAGLTKELERREVKVATAVKAVLEEAQVLRGTSQTAMETAELWYGRAAVPERVKEMHDYRKRTRSARYLAEMPPESAGKKRLAGELKRMQTAVGEWHDWVTLLETAKAELGKKAALVVAIRTRRDEALAAARRKVLRREAA